MKRLIGICLVAFMPVVCVVRAAPEETLGDKLVRMFKGPSPTPSKKNRTRSTTKKSPTPTSTPKPTATASSSASQTPSPSVSASPSPTAENSPSVAPSETPSARVRSRPHAPLVEPVRAMTPRPGSRRHHVETPPPGVTITSPPPAEERPTPMQIAPSNSPQTSAAATTSPPPSPPMVVKRDPKAPVSIPPTQVVGYETYSPSMRKVLDLSLELTNQNLGYKYGSADPKNGGMDCSGFIYYVLKQNGVKDPPRDAREQYIWVRKAGTFRAVLAHRDDSFELDELKPGDLLFWAGTYNVDRDPAITHTMIYLGREKGTNQRIMVGSSDGRTYKGQQKFGVSVFDFKVGPARARSSDERTVPTFVGYGRIPELPGE
jgi:peptidoglycan DL-endopeptidase CwlO